MLCVYGNRQNLGIVRTNENALWSLGVHDLSVILYLLDEEPAEAVAHGRDFLTEGVEDVVFCYLRFPSGKIAHMHLSWLDPHKMRRITVVGREKMVVFDDMELERKVTVYEKAPWKRAESYGEWQTRSGDIYIPKIPTDEPLRLECQEFLRADRGRRRPAQGRRGRRARRARARPADGVARWLRSIRPRSSIRARCSARACGCSRTRSSASSRRSGRGRRRSASRCRRRRSATARSSRPARSSSPARRSARACILGDQSCVRERVTIGDDVVVGRGSLVENDTTIGARTQIQADAYITAYSTLEEDVFIAPCVVTTNDNFMGRTERRKELMKGPTIRRGARVGGGAILCPAVEIGEEAFVGAGAVVTKDVPPRKVVVGSPARVLRDVPRRRAALAARQASSSSRLSVYGPKPGDATLTST